MTNKKDIPIKKRGRPKSTATIENEKMNELFRNIPEHLKQTSEEKAYWKQWLDSLDETKKEILRNHNRAIPYDIIFDLESLGHEITQGYEQKILDKYHDKLNQIKLGQKKSNEEQTKDADLRAIELWGKYPTLVKRIISKNLTRYGASKMILDNWNKSQDGTPPSIRTIQSWYDRYSLQRVVAK